MNITTNEFEGLAQFKRLIEGYLLSCVCIIGLIGNSITCLSILSNRTRRSSPTDIYILGLSFTSIFVLAGFLLTHGIRSAFQEYGEKLHRYLFIRVFPIHVTCILIQIYLTAAIAIDRFVLICSWRTLAYRRWRTAKRMIYIISGITLFSIIYCAPFWFEYVIIDEDISLSSIGSHPLFRIIVRKYLYFIFILLLPMSCIIICTLSIVRTLYNLTKTKVKNPSTNRTERKKHSRKVNTLLLSIMVIFLVTQLPYFIYNVIYAIQGPSLMNNIRARQYLVINNLLSTINASTTFILYAIFGRKKHSSPQNV